MNIAYPISEILKCVEIINQSEKKYYKSDDKTFNLNNNLGMKKKIIQTEGTFGELIETEELLEETFDDAEPFEIDEITKINDSGIKKNKKKGNTLLLSTEVVNQSSRQKMDKKYIDVIEEELKLMTKITNENKDQLKKYKNLNLILNEQITKLKERSDKLENDFNEVSKEPNHQTHDNEFQAKLDIIYKQQNIIKDYQDQIAKLKEDNQLLEQSTELPPSWLTGDSKFDHVLKSDTDKVSEGLTQQKSDDELKTKTKFIYEQQNIIKDYQDQIAKLKDENQSLEQNSEKIIHQEDHKDKMEDMVRKIKYYQDDNLRLSNELVQLSNKLKNTKSQLEYFENNKARLMSQLENLNNIISESNVIDNTFDTTVPKIDQKSSGDEKISDKKQIPQNQFKKVVISKKAKNFKEMDGEVKDIFKK